MSCSARISASWSARLTMMWCGNHGSLATAAAPGRRAHGVIFRHKVRTAHMGCTVLELHAGGAMFAS